MIAPSAPHPSDRPFGLVSDPLGEDSPCRIISIRLPQKKTARINICDFYLFRGRPGTTVMALTVNPNAGVGAPDTFRDEGLYAFRFDTDRDLREAVAFKVQFGAPAHADSGEHRHVQTFAVRRATGADALKVPRANSSFPGIRDAS